MFHKYMSKRDVIIIETIKRQLFEDFNIIIDLEDEEKILKISRRIGIGKYPSLKELLALYNAVINSNI